MSGAEIGPRQTVDRAKHPTLGEGRAVYDNGPAFFWPDGGEPVVMRSIGFGGCGSEKSSRGRWSNLRAIDATGNAIELDTLDRANGDRHDRRWHPIHGAGWLVSIGNATWAKKIPTARWDGDNGTKFSMRVGEMKVGKPADWNKNGDMRKGFPAESERWFTYVLDSDETFVFRLASPEELPTVEGTSDRFGKVKTSPPLRSTPTPRPAVALSPMATISPASAPAGSRWPDPNAPRAEVDAFVRRCG